MKINLKEKFESEEITGAFYKVSCIVVRLRKENEKKKLLTKVTL